LEWRPRPTPGCSAIEEEEEKDEEEEDLINDTILEKKKYLNRKCVF
jgi:hypothetical protein